MSVKANSCGTMVEQYRARLGWKSATERKACGADPEKVCRGCQHFVSEPYTNGDGGVSLALRCWHPTVGGAGFATRETAGCDAWERKLT